MIGSNSKSGDTDGDGYTDIFEYQRGTDLLDPQSRPGPALTSKIRAQLLVATPGKDSDGDGLSDSYEQEIKTDTLIADTDQDGMSDGIEILNGSNPLEPDSIDQDSDGDGLSDVAEQRLKTPVRQADLDNDGLSDPLERLLSLDPTNHDSNQNGIADSHEPITRFYFNPGGFKFK